jgi:thiamine-monophosphate kinase
LAGEDGILEALLTDCARPGPDWIGPGDDACVLPATLPGQGRLCLTADALEEGVHFQSHWQDLGDLARRLLAVNLSDLAAMGADPLGYVLCVGWPKSLGVGEAQRLGRALREAERELGCPLLGGDTDVRSGPLRLEATVLGRAPSPLLRSTGRAGDALFVSGPLGGAAAFVTAMLAEEPVDERAPGWSDARRRFLRPEPRLDLGRALRGRAHAVIDLSDGLLTDLGRLGRASGLDATVETARVPVHPAAARRADGLELALGGGEDYELLVAGPEALARDVPGLVAIGRLESPEGAGGRIHLQRGEAA